MPGQSRARGAAAHDLVGEKRMKVAYGVDLSCGGVGPSETEQAETPLHLGKHEARLLAHGIGAGLAAAYDVVGIGAASFGCLPASGDHEARPPLRGGHGEREGV